MEHSPEKNKCKSVFTLRQTLSGGLFFLQSLRIWLQIYYIIIHNYSVVVFFDKTLLSSLFKRHTLIKQVKTFKKKNQKKEKSRKKKIKRNFHYQMQWCETCSHLHSKPQQPCGVHTTRPASFHIQSNSARWWRGGWLWLNTSSGIASLISGVWGGHQLEIRRHKSTLCTD